MRKIFTVIIGKNEYDVYDIEGKEHAGHNDVPKTWWLYFSERLPEGLVPPIDSDSWLPFHKWINRRVWRFEIQQHNTTKYKWDETRFSNCTTVDMYCNNKLVYQFQSGGSDLSFVMGKIQYLQVILDEHPFNFFEPEKEQGRKIFFHGLPALIKLSSHVGEISILPEYHEQLTKEEWWKEYAHRKMKLDFSGVTDDWQEMDEEYLQEAIEREEINHGDALSDGNINWFRK